jgi:putative transposase
MVGRTMRERVHARASRVPVSVVSDARAGGRPASGGWRLVYNLALEQRRDHWRAYKRQTGKAVSYTSQARELTALRAEVPWIRSVSQTMQPQALRDLDIAYQRFFRGEVRYPRPRRRGEDDSVRYAAGRRR